MSSSRCHYEVLGVARDVSDTDLKKAYRKLALRHHPDKNQDNVEECTRVFNIIQQAYEVLSDPQERAWYDKHREEILHGAGSDFKDDSVNLMTFFSSSCFSGYGDDTKGFYAVYRDVFRRIYDEEARYIKEGETFLPEFGNSQSEYEEVHLFYSYWQSFSSSKSFVWEDSYDLKQAPNRRVQRLMEKENKKLREVAKKKRNEEIRQLVSFVRKRDKRVKEYKLLMEEKETLRRQKVAENREKHRKKRLQEKDEYQKSEVDDQRATALFEENLELMKAAVDAEFGKDSDISGDDSSDSNDGLPPNDLFCPACNKLFKSDKAFSNHERSKKHKEKVSLLKKLMKEEEEGINGGMGYDSGGSLHSGDEDLKTDGAKDDSDGLGNNDDDDSDDGDDGDDDDRARGGDDDDRGGDCDGGDDDDDRGGDDCGAGCSDILSKQNSDSGDSKLVQNSASVADSDSLSGSDIEVILPSQRRKNSPGILLNIDLDVPEMVKPLEKDTDEEETLPKTKAKGKAKKKKKPTGVKNEQTITSAAAVAAAGEKNQGSFSTKVETSCQVCHKEFQTRNKLFKHIKDTGHALVISTSTNSSKVKRGKKKK